MIYSSLEKYNCALLAFSWPNHTPFLHKNAITPWCYTSATVEIPTKQTFPLILPRVQFWALKKR
jgi:hypothetical protein